MIKSLFRQMWNQRHANVWVWVELIVVLILLWYSIDLVYNYEAAARQTKGYDTENVFDIQLNIKPALQNDSVLMSHSAEYLEQIYHLIQQYQGVEEACFYYGTIPYTGNNMYEGYAPHSDSTHVVGCFISSVMSALLISRYFVCSHYQAHLRRSVGTRMNTPCRC